MYTEPIRRSIYLVTTEDISIVWHGGTSYTVNFPQEWQDSYDRAARDWEDGGNDRLYRFSTGSPIGGVSGGQLHQGGLMINFFPGISIECPSDVSYLVTRPWNNFHTTWTVQDGIYRGSYKGDFSLNLQIQHTNAPVLLRRGELIATLFFFSDGGEDTDFTLSPPGGAATQRRAEEARRFYEKKQAGSGYRQQCPHAHAHP